MKTLAFISYSRKDKSVANWLHTKLEKFPYPESLVKIENRPPDKKYLRPVFIDTKDLSVDEHPFNDKIKAVLEDSRFLILICSKNSKTSVFVDTEVKYFLQSHEMDYSKIVPLFIDEVDDNIPPSILDTPVMKRHFPIYNTALSEKSEANIYCFYQITAYLLGIDFSYIYNRYENYAINKRKKNHLRIGVLVGALLVIILCLFGLFRKEQESLRKEQELARFEKNIFPRSVVTGYYENFLCPVISYMKEQNQKFRIYVLMPTSREEIENHQKRIGDARFSIVQELEIDSLSFKKLPTILKRGSTVTTICSQDEKFKNVFLDFVSTTSSFLEVAEYKKGHDAYKQMEIDDLVKDYATTFVEETKDKLGEDSVYIEFFFTKKDLISKLKELQETDTQLDSAEKVSDN